MKTTQKGTEGILNKVCRRYRCNAKNKTISIQNLIRTHKPKNQTQLRFLIESEKGEGCIDKWSEHLYDCYLRFKNDNPNIPYKNLEDCKIFMNYLFVEGSIKGGKMEEIALDIFKKSKILKDLNYTACMGSEENDFKHAIDIVIYDDNKEIVLGIQVKPESYKNFANHCTDTEVHAVNVKKNRDFGKPVLYIYYNKQGTFTGNDTFKEDYKQLLYKHKSNTCKVQITY